MTSARDRGSSTKPRQKLRCAIYTRKSSDDGLEQEFNSLHAQREACEAYIRSQREEGWIALDAPYDDGGFSGGNLERPALQQLLLDIKQKNIDIVVVYKVDRLTRALTDFARIVDCFDAHGVSFVSVTQQFNTTTSMGRLTLNVLLSFAQFEREVTGERIRDKIAASKQKGLWMGGPRPLGYDIRDKKLAINPTEAEWVRQLYRRYLEVGTITGLYVSLKSSSTTSHDDRRTPTGGIPRSFSRGHLHRILTNPLYIGKVRHRDQMYEGQHSAIIDHDTWTQVQQRLAEQRQGQKAKAQAAAVSLVAGLIEDERGQALIPHHTKKRGTRYRYYVDRAFLKPSTANAAQGAPDNTDTRAQGWRLPAAVIERFILQTLIRLLAAPAKLMEFCSAYLVNPSALERWLQRADHLSKSLLQQPIASQRALVIGVLHKIVVETHQVTLHLSPQGLYAVIAGIACEETLEADSEEQNAVIPLTIPWQVRRRGIEMRLVIEDPFSAMPAQRDDALIRAVAKGHRWFEELTSGHVKSINEIARQNGVTGRWVSRLINLAFLAPDIVERILDGTQPSHLTLQRLLVHEQLPLDWQAQRDVLLT